jgi:hypothetical protein
MIGNGGRSWCSSPKLNSGVLRGLKDVVRVQMQKLKAGKGVSCHSLQHKKFVSLSAAILFQRNRVKLVACGVLSATAQTAPPLCQLQLPPIYPKGRSRTGGKEVSAASTGVEQQFETIHAKHTHDATPTLSCHLP